VVVGSNKMVIQLDERLLNALFRYTHQPSHQDHERKKYLCNDSSQLMGQQDVLPPQDREDKKETSGKHEKDENSKNQTEDERKRGMNVLHPYHRNIPEQKDNKKENQTRKN
jgi:hypothetical protein